MAKHQSRPQVTGLKPGQAANVSGQYQTVGPRGGKGPEITAVKGHSMPPGSAPGVTYDLVDKTKHARG